MSAPHVSVDARLVLSEPELDAGLEMLLLAEAAVWTSADGALEGEASPGRTLGRTLGRGHWRVAFLLKRRPGAGVKELAALTGLSKQGASRILGELEAEGLVEKASGEDARRRPAELTAAGHQFEARVSERLRSALSRAYRAAGVENAAAARRVWAALAGAADRPHQTPGAGA